MNWLFVAYGLTSVIIIQIINSAEPLKGYKTFFSLLNLIMLYSCRFLMVGLEIKLMAFFVRPKMRKGEKPMYLELAPAH